MSGASPFFTSRTIQTITAGSSSGSAIARPRTGELLRCTELSSLTLLFCSLPICLLAAAPLGCGRKICGAHRGSMRAASRVKHRDRLPGPLPEQRIYAEQRSRRATTSSSRGRRSRNDERPRESTAPTKTNDACSTRPSTPSLPALSAKLDHQPLTAGECHRFRGTQRATLRTSTTCQ